LDRSNIGDSFPALRSARRRISQACRSASTLCACRVGFERDGLVADILDVVDLGLIERNHLAKVLLQNRVRFRRVFHSLLLPPGQGFGGPFPQVFSSCLARLATVAFGGALFDLSPLFSRSSDTAGTLGGSAP
jgi:hypothetical protein